LDYWYLTYGEIKATIEAKQANIKLRIREQASLDHRLANLFGLSMARLQSDKVEFPSLKEAYPNIFSDLVEEEPQEDWEVSKIKMIQYAEANNKKVR